MLESLMILSGRKGGSSAAPPKLGGGYHVGNIDVNGVIYALILSPKEKGESPVTLKWKTTRTVTSGTTSLNDGWANTQAMITAGAGLHPAAKFCDDLVINGHSDWYLPSMDELELCYRTFKPNTNNNSTANRSPNGADGINPSTIPPGDAYTATNPSQTPLSAFQAGGSEAFGQNWYRSSSQRDSTSSWIQTFLNGYQDYFNKSSLFNVRAVRRVLIG